MDKIIVELVYKKSFKIFLLIFGLIGFFGFPYLVFLDSQQNDGYRPVIAFLGVLLTLFSAYICIVQNKFGIKVNSKSIILIRTIGDKILSYSEIDKIWVLDTHITFGSKTKRIRVSNDLVNQKKAILFILEKIKNKKELEIRYPHNLKNWLGEEGAKEFMEGRSQ